MGDRGRDVGGKVCSACHERTPGKHQTDSPTLVGGKNCGVQFFCPEVASSQGVWKQGRGHGLLHKDMEIISRQCQRE